MNCTLSAKKHLSKKRWQVGEVEVLDPTTSTLKTSVVSHLTTEEQEECVARDPVNVEIQVELLSLVSSVVLLHSFRV